MPTDWGEVSKFFRELFKDKPIKVAFRVAAFTLIAFLIFQVLSFMILTSLGKPTKFFWSSNFVVTKIHDTIFQSSFIHDTITITTSGKNVNAGTMNGSSHVGDITNNNTFTEPQLTQKESNYILKYLETHKNDYYHNCFQLTERMNGNGSAIANQIAELLTKHGYSFNRVNASANFDSLSISIDNDSCLNILVGNFKR